MFKKLNFKDQFNYEFVYPTTHDAVLNICYEKSVEKSFDFPIETTVQSKVFGDVIQSESQVKE